LKKRRPLRKSTTRPNSKTRIRRKGSNINSPKRATLEWQAECACRPDKGNVYK
jgi:hypothetical protein